MKGPPEIFLAQHLWLNPAVTSSSPISPFGIDQEHPCFARKVLLWWGPDYISIYNDAYVPILRHHYRARLETRAAETTVSSWFKPNRQRQKIREDRRHLEAR